MVDLAAESGGNCELSRPGEDVEHHGVLVHGMKDAPSAMPVHASQLYARNVVNLLLLMTTDGAGRARLRRRDRGRRLRDPEGTRLMSNGITLLTFFVLAVFVGFEVVVQGVLGAAHAADVGRQRDPRRHPGRRDHRRPATRTRTVALVIGLLAVVLATVNMVGGFVVTDRMLEMFVRKPPEG